MLNGTIGAYLRYGSSVFASALTKKKNEEIVNKIHRKMLIIVG